MGKQSGEIIEFVVLYPWQYTTVVAISCLSCTLSILGSAWVALAVAKRRTVFERIMLGICLADIVSSTGGLVVPFSLPAYTGLPFAMGGPNSCRFVGVLFYATTMTAMYTASLTAHFWESVSRSLPRNRPSLWKEILWIHSPPWLTWFLIVGSALAYDTLQPTSLFGLCASDCHINSETLECTDAAILAHVIATLAFASLQVSAGAGIIYLRRLYKLVREQERTNQRFNFTSSSSEGIEASARFQRTWTQALFYTLACFNSLFALMVAYVEKEIFYTAAGWRNPWLFFFMTGYLNLMFPLQGFLNSLVYLRPRVVQWREKYPSRSLRWCCWQVLLFRKVDATRIVSVQCHPSPPNDPPKDLVAPSTSHRGRCEN